MILTTGAVTGNRALRVFFAWELGMPRIGKPIMQSSGATCISPHPLPRTSVGKVSSQPPQPRFDFEQRLTDLGVYRNWQSPAGVWHIILA